MRVFDVRPYLIWCVASTGALASPSVRPGGSTPPTSTPATTEASKTPLTLEAVMASVDAQYPPVTGALQDQAKAEGDRLAAEGGFDPVVRSAMQGTPQGEYENRTFDAAIEQPTTLWGTRFYGGYRLGRGSFGPYDEKLLTNQGGEIRAGAEVPLLRGGVIDDRRARLAITQGGIDAAVMSLASQRLDARRQATQKYFEWMAAGDKLKINQSLLDLAKTRDKAMLLRVRQGDAAAVDQVDNERSVLQREAALISAERSFRKASLELSLFYRDAGGQPIVPDAKHLPERGMAAAQETRGKPPSTSMTITAPSMDQHPDVRRLGILSEQNEVEVRLARNTILPKLDLDLGTSQDMGDGTSKKARTEYKVGLKVELPLFQRTARGRLAGALATGSKLQIQQGFARDRLRTALADSEQALAAAQERLTLLTKEVDLAAKVEKAEQIRWTHGDSNLLLVNIREQLTADARSRVVDAMLDYQRALAEIEAITAGQSQP